MGTGQFKVAAVMKGWRTHPGSPAFVNHATPGEPGWASCERAGVPHGSWASAQAEATHCQAKSVRTGGLQHLNPSHSLLAVWLQASTSLSFSFPTLKIGIMIICTQTGYRKDQMRNILETGTQCLVHGSVQEVVSLSYSGQAFPLTASVSAVKSFGNQ